MNIENIIPYSYHTFIYPFLYDGEMKDFCEKTVPAGSAWEITDDYGGKSKAEGLDDELAYQRYQYFSRAARKALLGEDPGICVNYRRKDVREKSAQYIVHKKNDSFSLNISDIVLKVFNTGVAMLVFETEYLEKGCYCWVKPAPDKDGRYEFRSCIPMADLRKNVRKINEFGRRLYPEYLPAEGCDICPDSLAIVMDGVTIASDDFKGRENAEYRKKPGLLPDIITKILGTGDVTSAIDDRMFVCCSIMDPDYVNYFLGYDPWCVDEKRHQQHDWAFRTDYDVGCELYALCNIDARSSSCQNRVMLDEYFGSQLYSRWLEWGTIHAVTNHSMVCLTGAPGDILASVVNPFLILYTQMCCLTLAQRATLIDMDDRITKAVGRAADDGRWEEVSKLEKEFALFQGQLMLAEVTPQIQGIELYAKLQDMLFVDKLEDNVQRQLNNLYEIAEAETAKAAAAAEKNRTDAEAKERRAEERRDRKINGFFTGIGGLTILSALIDTYSFFKEPFGDKWKLMFWIGTLLAISCFVVGVSLKNGLFRSDDDEEDTKAPAADTTTSEDEK